MKFSASKQRSGLAIFLSATVIVGGCGGDCLQIGGCDKGSVTLGPAVGNADPVKPGDDTVNVNEGSTINKNKFQLTAGDSLTFAQEIYDSDGNLNSESLFTRYFTKAQGGVNFLSTSSGDSPKSEVVLDENGQQTRFDSGRSVCGYSVPNIPGDMSVGSKFDFTYISTCVSGEQTNVAVIRKTGVVVFEEQKKLSGIDFATVRLEYDTISTSAGGVVTSKIVEWRLKNGPIHIARDTVQTSSSGASGAPRTTRTSYYLIGASVEDSGNLGPLNQTVSRFAGRWKLKFNNIAGDECDVDINKTGNFESVCSFGSSEKVGASSTDISSSGASQSSFASAGMPHRIVGSVDVNGVLEATSTQNIKFEGVIDSPISGSGSWTDGISSGKWIADHQ